LLQREVALKVCLEDFYEGRTIAQLEHEGIVQVHSQKVIQGYCVIDMQYVPSITLDEGIQELKKLVTPEWNGRSWIEFLERKFPNPSLTVAQFRCREMLLKNTASESVALLGMQIAEALMHAHSKGILHLDIKPENILIHSSGKPYVMDFNVSTQKIELEQGIPHNFGGTFDYMSPEQRDVFHANNRAEAVKKVTEASDVYSLGVVLLKMLEISHLQNREAQALKSILKKATEKEINSRFANMQQFYSALKGYLKLCQIKTSMPSLGPILSWTRRHPILGLTLLGGIPQLLGAVVGYLYNYSQVISRLGPVQIQLFEELNIYYGIITSALALSLWTVTLWHLSFVLKESKKLKLGEGNSRKREFLLSIPNWGALVATVSWLPGTLIFPVVMVKGKGGIEFGVAFHLVISFLLSYTIAFSYSFIIHAYLTLATLYSDFWVGDTDIETKARMELPSILSKVRSVTILTVMIPLFSILALIYRNDSFSEPKHYYYFRTLLVLLVSPGTLGIWFAFYAREQVRLITKLFVNDPN